MDTKYLIFIIVVIVLTSVFGLISKNMDGDEKEPTKIENTEKISTPSKCSIADLGVDVHFMIVQGDIRSEVSCQDWYRVPWERRELKLCDSNRVCQIIAKGCD